MNDELPPLPPVDGYDKRPQGHYSADSMRAYARAAILALTSPATQGAAVAEVVGWQTRQRTYRDVFNAPDEVGRWSPWVECSEGVAEHIARRPRHSGMQFEARPVYATAPADSPATEQAGAECAECEGTGAVAFDYPCPACGDPPKAAPVGADAVERVSDAMVERANEAHAAYLNDESRFDPCGRCKGKGYHHGFGEDGNDPDWCEECGGPGQIWNGTDEEAMRAALEAALAAATQEGSHD